VALDHQHGQAKLIPKAGKIGASGQRQ